jgi:hypothetical protein
MFSEGLIMKMTAATLIACFAALAAGLVNHALSKPGKKQKREQKEPRTYTLDVERPFAFLKERLPGALKRGPDEFYALDALDETAKVCIRRGAASVDMEVELITGTELDVNEYSIFLGGAATTLYDSYALALRLCDLAKIPNYRIVAWYKEKKYESPLGGALLQAAREGERRHEIEVHSSVETSGEKQWSLDYQIYFPGPKKAGKP